METSPNFRLGRSVSLTISSKKSKREEKIHDTPSPRPKVDKKFPKNSVCSRRAIFKEEYLGRTVKDTTKQQPRNSRNTKHSSPEKEKEDMATFIKEMREGLYDIRGDIATNNIKMDNLNTKIETLEKQNKSNEKKTRKDIDLL